MFHYKNRGPVEGKKGRKKETNPFREAFGRVKDLHSVLPGIPLPALTATVQVNERAKLMKARGIQKPVIVDVSPNKENISLNFIAIPNEKDTVTHLRWIADMVAEKGRECPQTQAAQALIVRSYYFFKKKSLCKPRKTRCRDLVTAIIHCYITTLHKT